MNRSIISAGREMRLVATRGELQSALAAARQAGKKIGLVPTMGALHEGHLSLVDAARRECDFIVATIFVNPTQFGPQEDYSKYPRTLEADLEKLVQRGVDLVFAPATEEIYRPGHLASVHVDSFLNTLEGAFRPGHFDGVATVVLKLFNLTAADVAFFGRKDYQQSLVIRRIVADLDVPIEIRVCPTVRDTDGLALSSRNVYLSPAERKQALALSQSLRLAAGLVQKGERDAGKILEHMRAHLLAAAPIKLDYVALVDPDTLEPVTDVRPGTVALVAARVGATRLIDNEIL
jgi:pantoate--beta-alanine ligase